VLSSGNRPVKAKIHYTNLPVASPYQVRNKLATGKLRGNWFNGFWAHSQKPRAVGLFRSLSALEQLQGPHRQWHIRCLSAVWSGTTLRRASVQVSKQPHATHNARPVGRPGGGRRLPQPGQLT